MSLACLMSIPGIDSESVTTLESFPTIIRALVPERADLPLRLAVPDLAFRARLALAMSSPSPRRISAFFRSFVLAIDSMSFETTRGSLTSLLILWPRRCTSSFFTVDCYGRTKAELFFLTVDFFVNDLSKTLGGVLPVRA